MPTARPHTRYACLVSRAFVGLARLPPVVGTSRRFRRGPSTAWTPIGGLSKATCRRGNTRFRRLELDDRQHSAHLQRCRFVPHAHFPRRRRPRHVQGTGLVSRSTSSLPDELAGKKLSLSSRGCGRPAYLSQRPAVGLYENGVTANGVDISDAVHFGDAENVLAVQVDNRTFIASGPRHGFPVELQRLQSRLWRHQPACPAARHRPDLSDAAVVLRSGTTGVYVYGTNFDIPGKRLDVKVESQVKNSSGRRAELAMAKGQNHAETPNACRGTRRLLYYAGGRAANLDRGRTAHQETTRGQRRPERRQSRRAFRRQVDLQLLS